MSKLTEKQKEEIINSSLSYEKLCKEYKTSKTTIGKLKKEAGVNTGRGNNTHCRTITPEVKKYILSSEDNAVLLAAKFGISESSVSSVRRQAEQGRGRGYRTSLKTTQNEIEQIRTSTLTNKDLAVELGKSYNAIVKIRRKLGLNAPSHSRSKTVFTEESLLLMQDLSLSALEIEKITGFGSGVINRKRRELGLSSTEFKKSIHKPKEKVYIYKPRPKKEKVMETKSIKKPIVPVRKSQFELENDRIRKAKITAEKFKEKEDQELATTHKFIIRVGRFGIKERVKVKRELHEIQ